MLEIAAVVAVVSEWPITPKRKVDSVGVVNHTRIVYRFASWQDYWGGIVDDAAFVVATPRVSALLRIVLVQCRGVIENEHTFSGMNFIHNDAVLVLCTSRHIGHIVMMTQSSAGLSPSTRNCCGVSSLLRVGCRYRHRVFLLASSI